MTVPYAQVETLQLRACERPLTPTISTSRSQDTHIDGKKTESDPNLQRINKIKFIFGLLCSGDFIKK
jgi:hypothetical protein